MDAQELHLKISELLPIASKTDFEKELYFSFERYLNLVRELGVDEIELQHLAEICSKIIAVISSYNKGQQNSEAETVFI